MKKFDGVLFCTDLDGTLFTDDKTVSKQNLDAIDYFKSEGGLFTFITGRMPKTSTDIYHIVKPNAPYGCINGGGIYDGEKERYLWTVELSREVMALLRLVDEQMPDMGIQVNTANDVWFCKDNEAMAVFRAVTGMPLISCHYEEVTDPLMKIIFSHVSVEELARLEALLKAHPLAQQFHLIRSEQYLYEILPKGVNKGLALRKMTELFGIRADRTVAVGDYYNDLELLQAAHLSYAVDNAADEIKAAAHRITVSNNDHAIAAIIDELDRGILTSEN